MMKYAALACAIGFVYLYLAVAVADHRPQEQHARRLDGVRAVANVYLMCKIGRCSRVDAGDVCAAVNFVALIVIWMAIAEARGKSKMLGALFVIFPSHFWCRCFLAAGPETNGGSSVPAAGPRNVSGLSYARTGLEKTSAAVAVKCSRLLPCSRCGRRRSGAWGRS